VPGNSIFPNKSPATLWLVSCCFLLSAQIHKVDPKKTVAFEVPGATAAYSMDAFFAEATAENGLVSIQGNNPGTTHVMVVTPAGVQTFEVLVTQPPPQYPAGFVMPVSATERGESGYIEGRYYSSPAQVQTQLDFLRIQGDDWTHVHVVETDLIGQLDQGQPRVALSSASYEVATPLRDIAIFDKYFDESPITINGSIVRGFHMTQDNWFVHAGYTSVATFDSLFLPFQPELVAGGGYRYPLTTYSSLTGSLYDIRIPGSDQLGRSGIIGDLKYRYSPNKDFWFNADLGISNGSIAGSGRLHYQTERDTLLALVRYMPEQFASLGANSLRGLHTDFSWTHHATKKIQTVLSFYNNEVVLPGVDEKTLSGSATLTYQLTRHWAVNGGAQASRFETGGPTGQTLRSFTLPVGIAFQSPHFGANGQYQVEATTGRDTSGQQFRASLRVAWGPFSFSSYAERDTDAPTLSFIFNQVAGLQQILNQQGLQATTVQQLDQLLSNDAYLIAAGYIKGVSINLVPARTQVGGTANWSNHGWRQQNLSYSFLYNNNEALLGSTEEILQTLSYTQNVTRSDALSAACSVAALKNPGAGRDYSPVCFISWRHQLHQIPYFVIPERRGTISGNVFRDDQSTGSWEPGMPPMAEVEVTLDTRRRTISRADGTYRFPSVPRGKHRITVQYSSRDPFFFTTTADLEVEEDAIVNFGIGYSLSGLMGQVLNDAGEGIGGIAIAVRSRGKTWNAITEPDGGFFVSSLVPGDYDVQADEDSLPAGYSADCFVEEQRVTVGASSPGKAAFAARALRSISGRVLIYDPKAGRYVPVVEAQVFLREPGLTVMTDPAGRYLFRDLPKGSYTLAVQKETRTVQLGGQPVDLTNIDFQVKTSGAPSTAPPVTAAAPVALPAQPQPLPAPVVTVVKPHTVPAQPQPLPAPVVAVAKPQTVSAQQHHTLGRKLNQAGQYREAIGELTEGIRIEPNLALAYNARGFARLKLSDWQGAIADLNRAILLDPSYKNAYKIRAVAKREMGDATGAAADLKKSQLPAH